MHIYFESDDYENDARPGSFGAVAIIGDEDGSHLVFITGNQVVADLPVPTGVMLEICDALGNAASDNIRAAGYDADNWQEEVTTGRTPDLVQQSAMPVVPPPPGPISEALPAGHVHHEYDMTPYGRREIAAVVPDARQLPGPQGTRPLQGQITPGRGQVPCLGGSRILRRTG